MTAPHLLRRGGNPFNRYDAACCGTLAAALCFAVSISAQTVNPAAAVFIVLTCLASLAIGRATLVLPIVNFRPLAELLFGLVILSLIVLAVCYFATVSAGTAAAIGLLAGLTAAVFCRLDRSVWSPAVPTDTLMVLLICTASLIWSWQAIVAVPGMRTTGIFRAWQDYFIHAGEIVQFAHFAALGGTSVFAAGAALPPYHYASYMLPAALCGVSGLPALSSATAFWTPLGFMLLGLGACALGGVLGGRACGIAAAMAVLLLPGASHYGLKNPFFDFHWLLQISSTGCYAVALSCLGLAAFVFWLRDRRFAWLVWSVFIVAAVALFRVHVFVPLAATLALSFMFAWQPAQLWQKPAAAVFAAAAAALCAVITEHIDRAPHFLSGTYRPLGVLLDLTSPEPSPYAGLFASVVQIAWKLPAVAAGLLLVMAGAFGLLLPIYAIGLFWHARSRQTQPEDWLPLFAVLAYCGCILLVPGTPKEPMEFAHRPFVLPYTLLAIWCAKFIVTAWRARVLPGWTKRIATAAPFLLLAVPFGLEGRAQSSALSWGGAASTLYVPAGLLGAADFLRAHAAQGDSVAYTIGPLDDALVALSERPAYYPGTDFLIIQSGLSADATTQRKSNLDKLLNTGADGQRKAAALGVAWIVTFPPTPATVSPGRVLDIDGFTVTRIAKPSQAGAH